MNNNLAENIIHERAQKYINLKKFNKKSKTNLIYEFNISSTEQKKLENECFKFINDNFKKHKFNVTKKSKKYLLNKLDALHTYTHNGALKPKKETIKSYKKILVLVIKFIEKIFPNDNVKSLTFPNLRIIRENKKLIDHKLSNKDTRILHTDIWVGQGGSGIFNIGIYGDFENSSVKYYDLLKFKKNYLKKHKKFENAVKNIVQKKYFTKLELGKAVYFDMIIPHHTFTKKNGKNRISLDFCVDLEKKRIQNNDFDYINLKNLKKNLIYSKIDCKTSILDAKKRKYMFNDGIFFKRIS